jgi:hypothetical protein
VKAVRWNRSLGTGKREQGILTPKFPKSKKQLKAAKKIAEKLEASNESE